MACSNLEDIEAVGHRIVHGADFFAGSVLVDEEVLSKIEFCNDFALHNPAHLRDPGLSGGSSFRSASGDF